MAQPQRQADVHQDELCPPKKRYTLMDANKKIDLNNPLCPNESKILANILQNHPLRFSIAASSSVPWIYLGQFWYTLKEDGSKYMLSFVLDRKELTMTLDDFRTIFQLPQAIDNNHEHFVAAPKFTKLIISHYITSYPKISKRVRDKYHNLEHDEMVKSIFNSVKNKEGVGMKIPRWMIFDEMKLTENYRMTTSTPRSPNHDVDEGESSAQRKSTVIRLRIPPRRLTQLTPPTPIPTTAEQNEEKVKKHLIAEEIEKLVEGTENVGEDGVDNSILNSQNDPDTRLNPGSYKESLEVEKTADKGKGEGGRGDSEYTTPTPTRSTRIHYTLISSDTEKLQELTVTDPTASSFTPSSSSSKLSATQRLLSLFKPKTKRFKRYKSFFDELQGRYGFLFGHLKTRFLSRKKFNVLAQHLQEVIEESLPKVVDDHFKELTKIQVPIYVAQGLIMERQQIDSSVKNYMSGHILHVHPTQANQASIQEQQYQLYMTMKDNPQLQHDDLPIWLALKFKFIGLHTSNTPYRTVAIRLRDQDDPHDDAHPKGENSAKRQKTFEHGTYVFGESSSGQVNESELGPSMSGNQEKLDDFDFWTDSYAIDDDELPTEKVSQELVEEMSQTVDETKLRKVVNEMLRQ
ncbi:hypothetical protein Tco_1299146 [Tanacetum coccineum]